jgi:NTE family protein
MRTDRGLQTDRRLQTIWRQERILATLRQTPEFTDVSGAHLLQFIDGVSIETTLKERTIKNLRKKLLIGLQGQFFAETAVSGGNERVEISATASRVRVSTFIGNSGVFNLDNVLPPEVRAPGGRVSGGGEFEISAAEPTLARQVRVRGPAEFVRIDRSRLDELFVKSDAFRRAVVEQRGVSTTSLRSRESTRLSRISALAGSPVPTRTIVFRNEFEGLPLPSLLQHLANRIGQDFNKRVLLLSPGIPALPQRVSRNVQTATGNDPIRFQGDFDYVFLDESHKAATSTADSVVTLTGRLPEPADWMNNQEGEPERLDVVLLQSLSSQPDGDLVLMPDAYATQTGGRYSACWLDLGRDDLEFLASGRSLKTADSETSRRLEDALGRWSRAVTHQRVGVALSGGGVWGFRHVAILQMLNDLGVPVDMVSGASIGAVVAAYYGARGMDGLDALLALTQSRALRLAQLATLVTALPFQWLLEADLGRRPLHGFTTRCLPVVTNLAEGMSHLVFDGTVGQVIAMCASPPGLTPSIPFKSSRFVDGAIMNDLPASVLTTFGADFTLAVNCYPLAKQGLEPFSPGPVGAFLQGLNPVRRIWDLLCGGNLMLYANGREQGRVAHHFIDDRQGLLGAPFEEPLLQAMDFSRAPQVIEQAMNDEALREQVEFFAQRWRALQEPAPPLPVFTEEEEEEVPSGEEGLQDQA